MITAGSSIMRYAALQDASDYYYVITLSSCTEHSMWWVLIDVHSCDSLTL
jgi:hypothetical protein